MAAIWKGIVRFEDLEIPVKLFAAIEDRSVHFRLLHAEDHVPVQQQLVDPRRDEIVPRGEMRKAYELEDGALVLLDEDELRSLRPESSREIEVLRFVPPPAIPEQWYDRPYHLGPDGSVRSYAALAAALRRTGRVAVVRWVMRNKDYVGVLSADEHRLSLVTLHWADEVIDAAELPRPGGRVPTKKELALAEQLVAALEEPLDMRRFDDEHRARVLQLIEAKAHGETVALPAARRKPAKVMSLEDALARSLRAAGKSKRAGGGTAGRRAASGARGRRAGRRSGDVA